MKRLTHLLRMSNVHSPKKCVSGVAGIGGKVIYHLSKLGKDKFSILCHVVLLVRLQGKLEIDHFWE